MSIRESLILELDGLMPGTWRSERERIAEGLITRVAVEGCVIVPGSLARLGATAVGAAEHISADGWTALCGVSLVDPDAPEPEFCSDCESRVRAIPYWRQWLARPLVRLAERIER